MGFPSEGSEAFYRNPMAEVQHFLESRHPGRYRVYNLCSERAYPARCFANRVGLYPFDDHNVPLLRTVVEFCGDVGGWLAKGEGAVAAVHCKAGKGRTGLMLVVFLLYIGAFQDVEEALEFYGDARTEDGEGVTIPCQKRYCGYFGRALADPSYPRMLLAPPPPYYLRAIRLLSSERAPYPAHIGALKDERYAPVFELHCEHSLEADYPQGPDAHSAFQVEQRQGEIVIHANVRLAGGVKLSLFKDRSKSKTLSY